MKRGRSETDIFTVGEPTPAPSPNPPDPFAQAMMAQLAQLQAQLQQYMTHPPTEPATPLSTTPTAAIPTPHSATPTDARVATPLILGDADEDDEEADEDDVAPKGTPPPPQCDGSTEECTDFRCILRVKWPMSVDGERWFRDHKFFRPLCPVHGSTNVGGKEGQEVCRVPVEGKGGYCRRRCDRLPDPAFFHILHKLSIFAPLNNIADAVKRCRNVVGRLVSSIAKCALHDSYTFIPRMKCLAVDETCIGKRKNNVGKRSRQANYWFFTATEIHPDGTAGRTIWRGTPRRTAELAQEFVASVLDGRRCVVYTDAAKCYTRIKDMVRTHGVVNHSIAFKNDDDEHTNHAEGAHGVVKDIVRGIWKNFGQKGESVEERAAFGAWLFSRSGTGHNRRLHKRRRLLALLELLHRNWPSNFPNYVFRTAGTEPREGELESEGDGEQEEEEEEEEEGTAEEEEEEEVEPILLPQNKRERLLSLRAGNMVSCDVIRVAMDHHGIPLVASLDEESCKIAKGTEPFAILLYYEEHFVMCVGNRAKRLVEVYDGRRHHAKDMREETLRMICAWLKELWGARTKVRVTMKEKGVVELVSGSECDSAISAINHAMTAFGKQFTHDRKSLRAIVNGV